MDVRVTPARPRDLRRLAAIEDAGLALFVDVFGAAAGDDGPLAAPAPDGRDRALVGQLLVARAGPDPVGFAHVVPGDPDDAGDSAHLEQLSVLPAHGRRGIGSALLAAAHEEARWSGARVMTLCTYRDVAWNAPFYARRGYTEVARPRGRLAERLAHERRIGLERWGARVAMARPLGGA